MHFLSNITIEKTAQIVFYWQYHNKQKLSKSYFAVGNLMLQYWVQAWSKWQLNEQYWGKSFKQTIIVAILYFIYFLQLGPQPTSVYLINQQTIQYSANLFKLKCIHTAIANPKNLIFQQSASSFSNVTKSTLFCMSF